MRQFKIVGGISGCKIKIDKVKVYKTSSDIEYNERLNSQLKKQFLFSQFCVSNVRIPVILNNGFLDSLFFFEMEYVSGLNPIEYFLYSDVDQINFFVKNIENYFNFLEKNITYESINIFNKKNIEKIQHISSKVDDEFVKFLEFLKLKINSKNTGKYPKSICHGDFTLSNIICRENQIYLIDFLDSYLDSLLIDLAKIKQDLFHKWTVNIFFELNEIEKLRINQILDFIWNKIETKFSQYLITDEFLIIEAMNFIRILPYAKNEKTKLFIVNKIKSLKIYEEFSNTDGW
jgi:hypothetical protein